MYGELAGMSLPDEDGVQWVWHDAYAEYPVVGVSWEQAKAFAHWRTFYKNQHQRKARKNIQLVSDFWLPTETEWEYAALA